MVVAFDVIGVIDGGLLQLNARFVERADIPTRRLYVLNDFLRDSYGAGGTLLFGGVGAGVVLLLPYDLLLQLSLCLLALFHYQGGASFVPAVAVLHDAV
ncbi:hypothetical protein P4Y30_004466 [Salmonella enterica]|nr:hypothetical protein [Salmonella enterica]EKQ3116068.1 hypothetical protein [Salmonella enterica]